MTRVFKMLSSRCLKPVRSYPGMVGKPRGLVQPVSTAQLLHTFFEDADSPEVESKQELKQIAGFDAEIGIHQGIRDLMGRCIQYQHSLLFELGKGYLSLVEQI